MKKILLILFLSSFHLFAQNSIFDEEVIDRVKEFKDIIDDKSKEYMLDGEYFEVSSHEVMDSGADYNDLGNLDILLENTSSIMNHLKKRAEFDNLKIISEFKKLKACNTCDHIDDLNVITPVSYIYIKKGTHQLNLKQIKYFNENKSQNIFILNQYKNPLIVKVVKSGNDEIQVFYYKRVSISNEKLKKRDKNKFDTSRLANRLTLPNGALSYDLTKGNVSMVIKDRGSSIEVKSGISSVFVDGQLSLGNDSELHLSHEYNWASELDLQKGFLLVNGKKYVGFEYERVEDDYGGHERKIKVYSELYKKRTKASRSEILFEVDCDERFNRSCRQWLTFKLKFN